MSETIQSTAQSKRNATRRVKLASFSSPMHASSPSSYYDESETSPYNVERSEANVSHTRSQTQAEELQQLRERNAELSHLVDIMPNGVVVLDSKGMVHQANKVAIDLLGEPLEGEKWRTVISRSFKPRQDDGHEVSLHTGRRVKLEITPLKSGQLIVMTDLTETRQLQDRISHLQRVSALGRMVASLAHQIRTPLSAAMLYAANLKNTRLKVEQRNNFVGKLTSRLSELENQVNDMLMFAKSGENQVLEQVSLQQLLTSVHQSSEAMVNQTGNLTVDLPEPDILLLANKTSLASAITNLIHNAVQVVGQGVHVHLAAQRDQNKPNQVVISVEDNGPGIEDKLINKIFEPFYTTRSQGTGLGLSVVKTVAQAHQGRVEVVNKQGGGAMFKIYLPIKLNAHSPVDVPTQQEEVA